MQASQVAPSTLYFDRLQLHAVQMNVTLIRSRAVDVPASVDDEPDGRGASASFGSVDGIDDDDDDDAAVEDEAAPTSTTATDVLLNMVSMTLGTVNNAPVRLDGKLVRRTRASTHTRAPIPPRPAPDAFVHLFETMQRLSWSS